MKIQTDNDSRWQRVLLLASLGLLLMGAVAGTASRWVGNLLVFDGTTGNNAFQFDVDGLRGDFGSGSDDYIDSNGTYARVGAGAGYLASAQPFVLASVYVNNLVAALTYGGRDLPANAFTVTAITYRVRAAGITGSTDNTFRISSAAGNCDCTFACNAAAANYRTTCTGTSGTGCAFAASSDLTFAFSGVGDCATATDIIGNIEVEGNWQ